MSNELVKQGEQSPAVPTSQDLTKANIRQIARMVGKEKDISGALTANTVDNMKSFLIVYARSQLNRVVKLTDALGNLEDKLIMSAMSSTDLDVDALMRIISTIQKSLSSSLDLVKQVTSDESYLNVIINNTEIVNNTINQVNVGNQIPVLKNQDSRDKVRGAVNKIMQQLELMEKDESLVVEVKPDEILEVVEEEE